MPNMVFVVICFALLLVLTPAEVRADYRETINGRLGAAKAHVQLLLAEDFNAYGSGGRDVYAKEIESPVQDCALYSIVANEKVGEPYFIGGGENLVAVPVYFELIAVDVRNISEPKIDGVYVDSFKNVCGFEYKNFDFISNKFKVIPGFTKKNHRETFAFMSDSVLPDLGGGGGVYFISDRYRYVSMIVKVKLGKEPFRLPPQIPRHYSVMNVVSKIKRNISHYEKLLNNRVSDVDPLESGPALERRLETMQSKINYQNRLSTMLLESIKVDSNFKKITSEVE